MTIVAVGDGDVVVVKNDTSEVAITGGAASDYTAKVDEVVADRDTERKVLASVTPLGGTYASVPVGLLLHFVEKGSLG